MNDELHRTDSGAIAVLTLSRPAKYNAISRDLLERLHAELDAIGADPAVRVVVVTGAGKAFCAGHDLAELRASEDAAQHA